MLRGEGGVREGVADPKLVSRKVGGDGRSPFPAEMWTLLAARREALSLVFTNPQAHGYLSADFLFFHWCKVYFFHSIFFFSMNKPSSKGFVFVLIFSLSSPPSPPLLVVFPHPADFSANPPLSAAVFPPSCPGCWGCRGSAGSVPRRPRTPEPGAAPGTRPVPLGNPCRGAAPRPRCPSPNLHKSAVALHHPSSLKGA